MSNQPRWPAGTPVAPSGKGPGGGRFRDGGPDWADDLAAGIGNRFTGGLMSHAQVARYVGRTDYRVFGSAGGGMGEVEFREYADGRRIAVKTIYSEDPNEIDAEVETSLVARALGVPTPAVMRDPDRHDTLFMEYIQPKTGALRFDAHAQASRETAAGRLLGLLDVIVGNNDRHLANVVLTWEGPVGIDHGLAFTQSWHATPQERRLHDRAIGYPDIPTPVRLMRSSSFGQGLFRYDGADVVQWVFSKEAIQEARRRIEGVRDQLRPHSYAGIVEVLDVLEPMSVGGQLLD